MTAEKVLTKESLAQFTGSEQWFRHHFNRSITYTEGVQYMAQAGGAYWLIDEIALRQNQKVRNHPFRIGQVEFQQWTLKVKNNSAVLTLDDGDGNVLYTKRIEFTDFPLDEIKLWVENKVIYLPSER